MEKKLLNQYFEWVDSLKNSKNEKILNELEALKELGEFEQQFVLRKTYLDMVGFAVMEQNEHPIEELLVDALNFYGGSLLASKYKYVFRVKVKGLEKYITREIAIPKNMSLGDFGVAIILAFNGECSHLFQFIIDKKRYVIDPSEAIFDEPESAFDTLLSDIIWNPKKKYTFVYDFGDDYQFSIQFVREVSDTGNYPIEILKGKGYGIWEDNHYYLELYYTDPTTMVENWDGDMVPVSEVLDFDPNEFDLVEINEEINDVYLICRERYAREEDEEGLPF